VSRYLILLILTTPFVLVALLNVLVDYKTKKISRKKFSMYTASWLVIFTGLLLAQPIYTFLFSKHLTATEPLSLFDVIQITGIVFLLFVVSRAHAKHEALEQHVRNLHQELSILLSEK
jgi:hypothetical protein